MAITHTLCPKCSKQVTVTKELKQKGYSIVYYTCGHSTTIKTLKVEKSITDIITSYRSLNNYEPFPFQIEGIKFAIDNNCRVLFADEMGLGKTSQSILSLRTNIKELFPVIVICKSIAKMQWCKEIINWIHEDYPTCVPQIIYSTNDKWYNCPVHILSFDTLNRLHKLDKLPAAIKERTKTVIIDECHYIKSNTAQRTVALKALCKDIPHVLALSGTPMKNNASEFFSVLNILRPDRFSNFNKFCMDYVDYYNSGWGYKYGGLTNPERFKEDTKDIIIRRTMDEVMPQLPELRRSFHFSELGDKVQEIYDRELEEFSEFWDENEGKHDLEFYSNIMARMARMRHITGLAKIDACIDFIEDFLEQTDRKITIFVHHQDVMEFLQKRLSAGIAKLSVTDEGLKQTRAPLEIMTLQSKDKDNFLEIQEEFRLNPNKRILIASTLAGGESINLQFCSDCIMLERQWNPGNEEQAERRFKRIGMGNNPVNINYLLAIGTIDEYFSELVEQKRQYFKEAMEGKVSEQNWDESKIMMELGERLASLGRKKWKIE